MIIMPSLAETSFHALYCTGEDNLVSDFYVPALSVATKYDTSAGYFTSSVLPALVHGLQVFLRRQGKIRLVISPKLPVPDVAAIAAGLDRRTLQILSQAKLLKIVEESLRDNRLHLQLLAALVAADKLDFRIAVPTNEDGGGIYHEKFGIFGDDEGDWIAFTGSPNETMNGSVRNFESVAVFRRNRSVEAERVVELRKRFDWLWSNNTLGVQVIDFPLAVRERLIEIAPKDISSFARSFFSDSTTQLRPYQSEAIKRWQIANNMGIWAMATGTGKTLAALECIRPKLHSGIISIVVVPGQDLLDQWVNIIRKQIPNSILVACSSENPEWRHHISRVLLQKHLPNKDRPPAFLIATASTASSDDFHRMTRTLSRDKILLIADEVHRLGSPNWRRVFELNPMGGRLGLSATPVRQWDPIGTKAILDFFGGIIFEYGLDDAMRDGWLCPYEYHVHPIGLTFDERTNYREISSKISQLCILLASRYGLSLENFQAILERARQEGNTQLEQLLFARADIVKGAAGKLLVVEILAQDEKVKSCLIYCNEETQVEETLAILQKTGRMAIGFTAERLSGIDRALLLRDFASGMYDFIVAIKCLDEGIDIPDARFALILASSKTEREWIQRRGRVLRKAPGKEKAIIHDCFVIPSRVDPDGNILDRIDPIEGAILDGEIARSRHFARSATNMGQAIAEIERLRALVMRSTHPAN